HEAMHAAHLAREFVADHVVAHPAVLASPTWFAAAARAAEILDELYRTFAAEHGAAAEAAAAEAVAAVMADAAGAGAEPPQRAPGGFI
ncbi:hypothetical protein NL436_27435, partial [Klebsiella pneumoniae]|nr:hypothetical protein [Klebsiella pneumoniae]